MSNEENKPLTNKRQIFDRTISVTTLITLGIAIFGAVVYLVSSYNDIQKQLYDLRIQDVKYAGDIVAVQKDLVFIRQLVLDLRTDQKETDSAIRKSVDTILDDLKKNREDMYRLFGDRANRRSLLLPKSQNNSDRDNCWSNRRYQEPQYLDTQANADSWF